MGMPEVDNTMVFEFQGRYSAADLKALALFVINRLMDKRIAGLTVFGGCAAIGVGILARSWFVTIGGFVVVLGLSVFVRNLVLPKLLLRRTPQPSGNQCVRMDGRNVRYQCDGIEKVYLTASLIKVHLTRQHLFLLFPDQGLVMVPLSWIKPASQLEEVAKLLVRGRDESHS